MSTELTVGRNWFPPLAGEAVWPHVSQWSWGHWEHWLTTAGWSAAQIEAYGQKRRDHGVCVQVKSGANKGKLRWLYQPTPKQVEAHECPAPNLLYGGAAGGAKSHWLRWDFYRRCLMAPGYKALILRRTFPELERTHMREAAREAEAIGAKYTDGLMRFGGNGSLIEFGHCQDDKAVAKYLSAEYDAIGADEAATFEQDMLLEIFSRARSTIPGVLPVTRATSNPGGAHTLWIRDFYMFHNVELEQYPFYAEGDWAFIPSKLYDNPFLMDQDGTFRSYEKRLGVLSPERRRQLLEGDWTAISGQFFYEWAESKDGAPWHVQDLGELGPSFRWFCSLDWGSTSPGACLWWVCLPDHRFHIRKEYKFQGRTIRDVALEMKRISTSLGLRKHPVTYCDPSLKGKTGQIGESYIETFQRHGIVMVPSNNDRHNGWQRVRELLAQRPDGEGPWLSVHPSCKYLTRSLPTLVTKDTDPEDLNSEGDDHAADALRYGAMSEPVAKAEGKARRVLEGSLAWWKQEPSSRGVLTRRHA